jgi:integrase
MSTPVRACPPETARDLNQETHMPRIDPRKIDQAFVLPGTPTFGELMVQVETDPQLQEGRRRDLLSGLRRVAKALGRAPEDVPADPRWLQPRLGKVMPAALKLSTKSWQNAVSDARMAMAQAGIVKRRNRHIDDLSPEWRNLWRTVLDSKDPTLPPPLCRFVHFLDGLGIAPEAVTQMEADAYLAALETDEIFKSPQVAWRAAINGWNLAGKRIDGWPQTRLTLPRRQKVYRLPKEALPQAFRDDLSEVLRQLSSPDPFAEAGPHRALRPQTLRHYQRQLTRFASELRVAGVPAEEIDSVASLCDPLRAERGLRAMVARRDNQCGRYIAETAALLLNLAGKFGLKEGVRQRLADLRKCVSVPAQRGMTRKNRDRLRVLQDERVLRRLLDLPERLFATTKHTMTPHAAAVAREDALAIALLLACPVRVGNLAGIHLDQHLQRPGDGRVYLTLAEEEVKNGRSIEFELPRDVSRMLDRHLATRSPQLCPQGTRWLFPRRDGSGPIDGNPLSSRLTKRIRKEIGIEMNAHLFRHLAAMVWLQANPGSYEAVRRLLGHSEISHTLNLYTGLEARAAIEAYGRILAGKRGQKP